MQVAHRAALRSTILVLLVLSTATLVGCGTRGLAKVSLRVFDCDMPLPKGYVVQATTGPGLRVYSRGDVADPFGQILLSRYEDFPPDRWEIVASSARGRLIVQHVRIISGPRELPHATVAHDYDETITWLGEARKYADAMVAACVGGE